jgi:hypothetical protein
VAANSGVEGKALSKAGKDILIKAIAQEIPMYAMSCFDLTKTLCDDIGTMINRFWWAQQEDENKMHWLSKEKVVPTKEERGIRV